MGSYIGISSMDFELVQVNDNMSNFCEFTFNRNSIHKF